MGRVHFNVIVAAILYFPHRKHTKLTQLSSYCILYLKKSIFQLNGVIYAGCQRVKSDLLSKLKGSGNVENVDLGAKAFPICVFHVLNYSAGLTF